MEFQIKNLPKSAFQSFFPSNYKRAIKTGLTIILVIAVTLLAGKILIQLPQKAQAQSQNSNSQVLDTKFGKVAAHTNPLSKTPRAIFPSKSISLTGIKGTEKISDDNLEGITKKFIEDNFDLLKAKVADLKLAEADHDEAPAGKGTGTWYIFYDQIYNNLPVEDGGVNIIISNEEVITFGSDFFQGINIDPTPKITEQDAKDTVKSDGGFWISAAKLVVLPKAEEQQVEYFLTYKIDSLQWRYFVDALDGSIVQKTPSFKNFKISGKVTADVYIPNQLAATQEKPLDDAIVEFFGPSGDPIVLGLVGLTDIFGNYFALAPSLLGNVDVKTSLNSLPVRVCYDPDLSGNLPVFCLLTELTRGSLVTNIPNLQNDQVVNFRWIADGGNSVPASKDRNLEANIFYHVQQAKNFWTKGGVFNLNFLKLYNLTAIADSNLPLFLLGSNCQAISVPSFPITIFGKGSVFDDCDNFGLDSDVIYHEYTHHAIFHIYGNQFISDDNQGQDAAIEEGFSDYFAATINNDPKISEGALDLRPNDIRTLKNSLTTADLTDEGHHDGQVIGGAAWDLRELLKVAQPQGGIDKADGLIVQALKTRKFDFTAFLNALITVDDAVANGGNQDLSDGTPNLALICLAFARNHQIGTSLTIQHGTELTGLCQDLDNDFMTDLWETNYFCLNPETINDANEDPDGDSLAAIPLRPAVPMKNIDEMKRKTNPCAADTDGDLFNDGLEVYITTDPTDACANKTGHDAWPVDLNNDRAVSIRDISIIVPQFGKGGPRYDLNGDGGVSITDILIVINNFGKSCTD